MPVFSNLGRLDRLRATGKVDEVDKQDSANGSESANDTEDGSDDNLEKADKRKNDMRFKGSGLERWVSLFVILIPPARCFFSTVVDCC